MTLQTKKKNIKKKAMFIDVSNQSKIHLKNLQNSLINVSKQPQKERFQINKKAFKKILQTKIEFQKQKKDLKKK